MVPPQKSRLSTLRKTTNPHSSAKRQVKRRSKKAHIHISLRRSFRDKVDASATVEESGIKFNNMFTVDDQRHTKSTIAACVTPHTELTFLEPEAFPPDEAPALTETGTHLGVNVHGSNPSYGTRSTPQRPPDAWVYQAAGSGSGPVPRSEPMPREAHLIASCPSGYTPWPQAYPRPHHDVGAESRPSLYGWTISPPEHVAETASLARGRSSSTSSPGVSSALQYDRYRYAGETTFDEVYATNRWDSGISQMQHMPSQPLAVADERGFTPQPFMHDADRLRHGATQALGKRFRGGPHRHLDAHSAVWPSGDIPRHKQTQTIDNRTAQGAQFSVVYSPACSCGRNAREQVGCLCKPITTDSPWDYTAADAYWPVPPTHIWQGQWTPEDPVSAESTSNRGEYQCYAPAEDVGRAQAAYGLDPRPSAYYNYDLPGAIIDDADVYSAPVEGFEVISPYAYENVPPGWGTAGTSAGPSYQGTWC